MSAYTVYVKGEPETNTLGDCPFCHRVLLTLENKNVPYTKSYIDFAHKPDWLQERSGGKVPVINDGEFWLPDSDKIVVFLEEKFPEPSMSSDVPPEVGAKLFPAFRQFLQSPKEGEAEAAAALEAELDVIEAQLQKKGPLFGGDHLDSTDAAVAPKLYHVESALNHFKGWVLPTKYAAITKYLATVKGLEVWKKCDYGEAMIIKGWSKHH